MQVLRVLKKFNIILSNRQKLQMTKIFVLMVIGGFLETFSVSLMLPFMNIVMNPEKTMENQLVRNICRLLGIQSAQSFLVVLAITLGAVFLIKNAFLLMEYNAQYRFVYGNMIDTQKMLLNNLIHKPYEFFLKIETGEIVRIINNDTTQTFFLLTTLLQLFTELIVSGMIIITVVMIAPIITIFMAIILLLVVLAMNFILKPILRNMGKETQNGSAGMNKWLIQSIQGIKELKVLMKEDYFKDKFSKYGDKYVVSLRQYEVLSVAPRFIIEATSMCAMFAIVALLIYNGAALETVVPILTATAMAAIRLLPSVNRIISSLTNISYREPMLDKLIEHLEDISETCDTLSKEQLAEKLPKQSSIQELQEGIDFSKITYFYPDSHKAVLKEANMKIKKGQSVGIIGPSGSGKTTAVDILLGLLRPEEGIVSVDGISIVEDKKGFLNQVGYIPQSAFLLDDSIRANVTFGEENARDEDVWSALEAAALSDFVRELPDGIYTKIGERGVRLSGGQKQRIGIARALFRNPSILVFDEATSALDNETEKSIMQSINHLKGKKTMIIIAHRLTTIENCDMIFKVENGKSTKEKTH